MTRSPHMRGVRPLSERRISAFITTAFLAETSGPWCFLVPPNSRVPKDELRQLFSLRPGLLFRTHCAGLRCQTYHAEHRRSQRVSCVGESPRDSDGAALHDRE